MKGALPFRILPLIAEGLAYLMVLGLVWLLMAAGSWGRWTLLILCVALFGYAIRLYLRVMSAPFDGIDEDLREMERKEREAQS